ncbi:MAG: haloacid dehalogenase-like hydrolase [Eubacterium sp.]|nr:haloacid dehalogenase-like hydrolase [Eubacterium sp.]
MNVYDFDNTIYDGESVFDFFLFCLKKQKSLILYFPMLLKNLFRYKAGKLSIDELYEEAGKLTKVVIKNRENADEYIREFWSINSRKLKQEFLDKLKGDDVILTASPDILIKAISDKLKTDHIIGSRIDLETGKMEFACFRQNKITAFKESYPNAVIDEFYTDSLNDMPIAELADKAYLIKKNKAPQLINGKE